MFGVFGSFDFGNAEFGFGIDISELVPSTRYPLQLLLDERVLKVDLQERKLYADLIDRINKVGELITR